LSQRKYNLKYTYGITEEEYNQLLEKQNHRCFVCERHESTFNKKLSVDHDHKTGEIRGLLCTNCNRVVIGRHTDPRLLSRAAEYLSQEFTGWFVPKRKKRRSRKKIQKIKIEKG